MDARKLQILFEHRLLSIDPRFEFEFKPKSDVIFEHINIAIYDYVKSLYTIDDGTLKPKVHTRAADLLRKLVRWVDLNYTTNEDLVDYSKSFVTTKFEYLDIVKADLHCSKTYNSILATTKYGDDVDTSNYILPTLFITEAEASNYMSDTFDLKVIKQPYLYITSETEYNIYFTVLHDRYTVPTKLKLQYVAVPGTVYIAPLTGVKTNFTDLPEECAQDVISLAVQSFLSAGINQPQQQEEKPKQEQQ